MASWQSAALLLGALTLFGCGDKDSDSASDGSDGSGSSGLDAETQALLDAAETATAGYESWGQLEDWTGIQPSDSVHGDYVQIWLNDAAYKTIEAAAGGDMPDGAILIKQGYSDADGAEKGNLTMMQKVEGYGWFWASWSSSGDVLLAGQPSDCTGCHESGQDSVRVTTW